jgi:uracil-DNA glycosylase
VRVAAGQAHALGLLHAQGERRRRRVHADGGAVRRRGLLRRRLRELLMPEPGEELAELGQAASGCTRCRLAETRTQVVFGTGNPDAELMLVGEAPGANEDLQGEPFVGRSGQLLNRMLETVGLTRDEVYVANSVKCRPPDNRDPKRDEIAACSGYLAEQVRLVDPKVVLTLGNFAAKTLLQTKTGITSLRGQTYEFQGRTLVPTFHPAAALRFGRAQMQGLEDDFRTAAQLLRELERPADPAPAGPPSVPVPHADVTDHEVLVDLTDPTTAAPRGER